MATPQRKSFQVKSGNSHISVYPYRHPETGKEGWRFAWRKTIRDKWSYVTAGTKAEIEGKAEKKLGEMAVGGTVWSSLSPARLAFHEAIEREVSPEDESAVLAFIAGRKKSGSLADAVTRFVAWKVAAKKGKETAHLATVRRDLESLAKTFPKSLVIDVTLEQLAAWWDERTGGAGDARRKGIRTTLVMFWRWARKDGIAGSEPDTVAQRLPSIEAGEGKLEIFNLPEFEFLLSIAEKEWYPLLILGAFEGIRPEEIAPKKDNVKPGLRWEHIDWDWDVIRVPKEVSKTGRARIIPLHPAARAWLEAIGAGPTWTGVICEQNPTEVSPRATTTWGKALAQKFPDRFDGWPQDALRHSYASYRNAVIRNLPQVAEEMGTSEDMLHGHYHNPRIKQQGEAWFQFLPAEAETRAAWLKLKVG
jgi:integrase